MTLDDYLKQAPWGTASAISRDLGVATGTVSQWRNGTKRPRPELALALERWTRRAVRVEDMRPDINWSRRA